MVDVFCFYPNELVDSAVLLLVFIHSFIHSDNDRTRMKLESIWITFCCRSLGRFVCINDDDVLKAKLNGFPLCIVIVSNLFFFLLLLLFWLYAPTNEREEKIKSFTTNKYSYWFFFWIVVVKPMWFDDDAIALGSILWQSNSFQAATFEWYI